MTSKHKHNQRRIERKAVLARKRRTLELYALGNGHGEG